MRYFIIFLFVTISQFAFCHENISNADFGVEKFAEEMNLSRTQLFRKVKALMGESPSDFINKRLQKASDLIIAKADTLTQICYSVGFNEPSYFAKRFRKKFGVAPSEYVKSLQVYECRMRSIRFTHT